MHKLGFLCTRKIQKFTPFISKMNLLKELNVLYENKCIEMEQKIKRTVYKKKSAPGEISMLQVSSPGDWLCDRPRLRRAPFAPATLAPAQVRDPIAANNKSTVAKLQLLKSTTLTKSWEGFHTLQLV